MFNYFASSPSLLDSDADMLYLWIRVVAFIGVLGASAYFLSLYTKKKRTRLNTTATGGIVIADTRSLGNRQFLMVAQYGEEKHLLGVSSGSINHLAKLNDLPPHVAANDLTVKEEE